MPQKLDPKKYCELYLMRHGETEHNVSLIIQGQTDSQLTENGKADIQKLAHEFKGVTFDAVYSSDLLRAKQTAKLMTLERTLAVNTSKLLRERFFGQFEGMPRDYYLSKVQQALDHFRTLPAEQKMSHRIYRGIETDNQLAQRFLVFVREVAAASVGKTVLVVTHGGTLRSFLIHLGFATHAELPFKTIENLAYARVYSDGVDFFVEETRGINKVKPE